MAHPPRIPGLLEWEQRVVYFVTFCVAGRQPVLANEKAFAGFRDATAALQHWELLAAVLMPDHVHVLAAPAERDEPVGNLSAGLKRRIRRSVGGEWEWQRGCFDRLLRRDESLEAKWHYIRENPVRAGLVERWEQWPYRVGFEGDEL